jgi:hypothetical protein
MDDESDWRKQLMVGAAVLVVVGLLVGGIVGLIALKAADVAGFGKTHAPETGVTIPTKNTPRAPKGTGHTQPPATEPGSTTNTKKPRQHPRTGIRLTASPDQASTYQRVNLTGTYPSGAGATLQVQRLEGGNWVDFPTSASVSGGSFSTYVETGRSGPNKFRVFDAGSGRASNVVTVVIT